MNSFILLVTIVLLLDIACAAIKRSIDPIGVPFFSKSLLILPYTSAALSSKARVLTGDRNVSRASLFFIGLSLF